MPKAVAAPPADLAERRAFECRLTADRWLESLEDAQAFMLDRQMLSIAPSSALPSVFGACAPNPDPLARGYAAWPPGKWWWPSWLSDLPEVQRTRLLSGHVLLVTADLFARISPLCVRELGRAEDGELGAEAQQLVRFLDQSGPMVLGDARAALGLAPRAMAALRDRLESVGAVVSEDIELPARNGGHIHTSRLFRADQLASVSSGAADLAHRELLCAAVAAAVVASRKEAEKWFAWPAASALDALTASGVLTLIDNAWLTSGESVR